VVGGVAWGGVVWCGVVWGGMEGGLPIRSHVSAPQH
jgi:hypothetical protein